MSFKTPRHNLFATLQTHKAKASPAGTMYTKGGSTQSPLMNVSPGHETKQRDITKLIVKKQQLENNAIYSSVKQPQSTQASQRQSIPNLASVTSQMGKGQDRIGLQAFFSKSSQQLPGRLTGSRENSFQRIPAQRNHPQPCSNQTLKKNLLQSPTRGENRLKARHMSDQITEELRFENNLKLFRVAHQASDEAHLHPLPSPKHRLDGTRGVPMRVLSVKRLDYESVKHPRMSVQQAEDWDCQEDDSKMNRNRPRDNSLLISTKSAADLRNLQQKNRSFFDDSKKMRGSLPHKVFTKAQENQRSANKFKVGSPTNIGSSDRIPSENQSADGLTYFDSQANQISRVQNNIVSKKDQAVGQRVKVRGDPLNEGVSPTKTPLIMMTPKPKPKPFHPPKESFQKQPNVKKREPGGRAEFKNLNNVVVSDNDTDHGCSDSNSEDLSEGPSEHSSNATNYQSRFQPGTNGPLTQPKSIMKNAKVSNYTPKEEEFIESTAKDNLIQVSGVRSREGSLTFRNQLQGVGSRKKMQRNKTEIINQALEAVSRATVDYDTQNVDFIPEKDLQEFNDSVLKRKDIAKIVPFKSGKMAHINSTTNVRKTGTRLDESVESCDVDQEDSDRSQQATTIDRAETELKLKFKDLDQVPIIRIQNKPHLRHLDLSHNKIQVFDVEIFPALHLLQTLNLSNNELTAFPPQPLRQKEGPLLPNLKTFVLANNRLTDFPSLNLLVSQGETSVVVRDLNVNNNLISKIPSGISNLIFLNSLLLHSNPIRTLPVSMREIMDSLTELSIDWFSYLQPFVGKIVALKDEQDTKQSPSKQLKIDFKVGKKNNSFIPALSKAKMPSSKQARVFEKLKELFFSSKADSVSFSEFIFFAMRKTPQAAMDQVIRKLRYQKERSLLQVLAEDGHLHLVKDIHSTSAKQSHLQERSLGSRTFVDVNYQDAERSTAFVIALKNNNLSIAKYLLKAHKADLDIITSSIKLGNPIELVAKSKDFEFIEDVLGHSKVTKDMTFILNYFIPAFDKQRTHAKHMLKLIFEKGIDPNKPPVLFRKETADSMLPMKKVGMSAVALTCSTFQKKGLNFLFKYNTTVREIIRIHRHVCSAGDFKEKLYWDEIEKLQPTRRSRVTKYFSYILSIAQDNQLAPGQIIENNLKLIDFNLRSGEDFMHPLHFAVRSNNTAALKKFVQNQENEKIDFFTRDDTNLDLAQEMSAPSAAVYKVMRKIQGNQMHRQFLSIKAEQKEVSNVKASLASSKLSQHQQSIGSAYLEGSHGVIFQQMTHTSINLRHKGHLPVQRQVTSPGETSTKLTSLIESNIRRQRQTRKEVPMKQMQTKYKNIKHALHYKPLQSTVEEPMGEPTKSQVSTATMKYFDESSNHLRTPISHISSKRTLDKKKMPRASRPDQMMNLENTMEHTVEVEDIINRDLQKPEAPKKARQKKRVGLGGRQMTTTEDWEGTKIESYQEGPVSAIRTPNQKLVKPNSRKHNN